MKPNPYKRKFYLFDKSGHLRIKPHKGVHWRQLPSSYVSWAVENVSGFLPLYNWWMANDRETALNDAEIRENLVVKNMASACGNGGTRVVGDGEMIPTRKRFVSRSVRPKNY